MSAIPAEPHFETDSSPRSGAGSYRDFMSDREEVMRHKWLLSERAGYDVGLEATLLDWVDNHRAAFHKLRAVRKSD